MAINKLYWINCTRLSKNPVRLDSKNVSSYKPNRNPRSSD
nr:MAG TPA: hypothetical protein [Caudoviricetes sp.]